MMFIPIGRSALVAAGLLASLSAQTTTMPSASPSAVAGIWRGEARRGGAAIEVFIEVVPAPGGAIDARLTVPGTALRHAVVGTALYRDRELVLEAPAFGGRYRGKLSDDGRHLRGSFVSQAEEVPLELERAPSLPPPDRPQEPRRPYPYRDEEVSFVNEKAGIRFHGTLTLPNGPGPHPAAVLITGSGCQDRDETLRELRPFLVIADDLTRRGVAVLRCDDRGFGETKGNVLDATSEESAFDVLAGIAFLQGRPEIDRDRIGVIGHSEGGMIAMITASRSADVKFAVSLAGVAVKCDTLAHDIFAGLSRHFKMTKLTALAGDAGLSLVMAMMKSSLTDAQLAARLGAFLPPELVPLIASRWARFMVRYDPGPAIEKVKCPILGIYLAADVQVPAAANAAALEAAAKRGGNPDVTIVTLPRLDHAFQIAAPGPADAERAKNTVAPEVLDAMGPWVVARVQRLAESRR